MNSILPLRTLFVLTSHTAPGETGNPTGFWFEELAAPWWALRDAGLYADIATVRGGHPVADPASLSDQGGRTAAADRFLADSESTRILAAAPGIAHGWGGGGVSGSSPARARSRARWQDSLRRGTARAGDPGRT